MPAKTPGSTPPNAPWPVGFPAGETSRQSRGLEQFLATLRNQPTCSVLDLGGANQANINFVTNLGHRISSESLLHGLDTIWNNANATEAHRIEDYLEQTLNYQADSFGGVLVWDTLQYLPQPLLEAVVARIYHLLQPGALLLSFFHAGEKTTASPSYVYRITDSKTMLLSPRGFRTRELFFNNRALEKMFESYGSVKFFLTRDHLREVLVKR